MERSLPLPALSPLARRPAPVDALLIGCMHRVAHRHADYGSASGYGGPTG